MFSLDKYLPPTPPKKGRSYSYDSDQNLGREWRSSSPSKQGLRHPWSPFMKIHFPEVHFELIEPLLTNRKMANVQLRLNFFKRNNSVTPSLHWLGMWIGLPCPVLHCYRFFIRCHFPRMLLGFEEREGKFIFKRQRLGWEVQKYCSSHRISDFNPGLTMHKLNGSSRPAGQLCWTGMVWVS